jgi:hypothetical protein
MNAIETHSRHAVHIGRQQNAMPVNRRGVAEQGPARQQIVDAHGYRIAFTPAYFGGRQAVVDDHCRSGFSGEIDRHLADAQMQISAAQYWSALPCARRHWPGAETGHHSAGGNTLYKTTTAWIEGGHTVDGKR